MEWLELIIILMLIALPFLAVGFIIGYATGKPTSNPVGVIVIGLAMMVLGGIGATGSVGLFLPLGALLASFGFSRRWKGRHYSTA
ncbi:MAG: hypothetical protein E6I03_08050 [Chloroflexi bacterium]|nr:MAG: hypothetical protein E6I03_08050 [Chloroflexota bacterium]